MAFDSKSLSCRVWSELPSTPSPACSYLLYIYIYSNFIYHFISSRISPKQEFRHFSKPLIRNIRMICGLTHLDKWMITCSATTSDPGPALGAGCFSFWHIPLLANEFGFESSGHSIRKKMSIKAHFYLPPIKSAGAWSAPPTQTSTIGSSCVLFLHGLRI